MYMSGTTAPAKGWSNRTVLTKLINHGVSLVTLMNEGGALGHYSHHGFVGSVIEELNPMGIVVAHLRIPLVLLLGIGQAISNGKAGQVDWHCVGARIVVTLVNCVGNGGNVVSGVGFPNHKERILGIFRVGLEKGLQEEVGILRYHGFVGIVFFTIRETNSSWLIEPQNMSCFCPTVWVWTGCFGIVVDGAGAIFREHGQGAGTSRSSSQPENQGSRVVKATAFLIGPEKEMLVLSIFVILASFDVHVAADGFGTGITEGIII